MAVWNEEVSGWRPARRERKSNQIAARQWPPQDLLALVVAFVLRWELGLAFLVLKLWQQASGHRGSVFGFARERWESLVDVTRRVGAGASLPSFGGSSQTSGNRAFDDWRQAELDRIEAERARLKQAERDFADYRERLLHARDQDEFSDFMRKSDKPTAP